MCTVIRHAGWISEAVYEGGEEGGWCLAGSMALNNIIRSGVCSNEKSIFERCCGRYAWVKLIITVATVGVKIVRLLNVGKGCPCHFNFQSLLLEIGEFK